MKQLGILAIVLACGLAASGCATEQYAQRTRYRVRGADTAAAMTKADVIAMSKAGIGSDVIIRMMHASGSTFNLRPADAIELADSGVTDTVIGAMINSGEAGQAVRGAGRYYSSLPYYWYADAYLWYPWSPAYYFGYPFRYYRSYYTHPFYFRHYGGGGRAGFMSGRGTGGYRASGRGR